MMDDELRDLYQEVILDHGKKPRNFRTIDGAPRHAHGRNPLCGDQLVVYLDLDGQGRIGDVSFLGKGCAISVASASLMTEMLRGKTREQAEALFHAFHALCTGDEHGDPDPGLEDDLDRLQVLAGVRQFPVRVKCATLAWHTMDAALRGQNEVSTEV